jgi:hypothetical protein
VCEREVELPMGAANFGHGMVGALLEVSFHLMVDMFYTPLCGMWWKDPRKVLLVFPLPLAPPINRR